MEVTLDDKYVVQYMDLVIKKKDVFFSVTFYGPRLGPLPQLPNSDKFSTILSLRGSVSMLRPNQIPDVPIQPTTPIVYSFFRNLYI